MNSIYNGFNSIKGLNLNNPRGQNNNTSDNKPPFLTYRIITYPKNFTENLVLEISTNLLKDTIFNLIVYDIDSFSFKDVQQPLKDAKIINKQYAIISENFVLKIPFNRSAQSRALNKLEGQVVECYFGIGSKNIITKYSETFYVDVSKNPQTTTQSEIKIIKSPLNLTNEQKAKFIAAILVESSNGRKPLRDIAWIYFNLVQSLGFEKGLNRSSAYYKRKDNYMFKSHLYFLGYGKEYKDDYGKGEWNRDLKVQDYVKSEKFKTDNVQNIMEMKKFIQDNIFSKKPATIYDGWEGQGNTSDMNIADGRYEKVWEKARQYYWLQKRKGVNKILVKKLYDGEHTSYLYDTKSIESFFKKNPNLLPQTNDIPEIPHYTESGNPYINVNKNGKIQRQAVLLDEYGAVKQVLDEDAY